MKLRRSEKDAVVEMLEKTPVWSGLSKKDLGMIVERSLERKFDGGSTIVSKGETGVAFYLILEGSVEVKSDGRRLSKLKPGQFFGEMSVLDNQPRSADIVAVEPSRVLVMPSWIFNGLISVKPKIALKMLREFVRRLRATDRAFTE